MSIQVMRAVETWQHAGAYYVRIQAMAKQYHITLREKFDGHDTPDAKYIVLLDDDFPVATCRLYEYGDKTMMLGRVVVLPELALGCTKAVLESRDTAVGFYEKLGYAAYPDRIIHGGTFTCIYMEKSLY